MTYSSAPTPGAPIGFVDAVKTCFRNYFTFSGRAGCREFWWFILFLCLGQLGLGILDGMFFHTTHVEAGPGYVGMINSQGPLGRIFTLATVIPTLAVGSRRLHDTNRSGWWQLLHFVPLIGSIILLVFFAQGPRDQNRFGRPI